MDFTRFYQSIWVPSRFRIIRKRQQISTVAKLCILTNDKQIKGILTLRNEFHENSRIFLAQREYQRQICSFYYKWSYSFYGITIYDNYVGVFLLQYFSFTLISFLIFIQYSILVILFKEIYLLFKIHTIEYVYGKLPTIMLAYTYRFDYHRYMFINP